MAAKNGADSGDSVAMDARESGLLKRGKDASGDIGGDERAMEVKEASEGLGHPRGGEAAAAEE